MCLLRMIMARMRGVSIPVDRDDVEDGGRVFLCWQVHG